MNQYIINEKDFANLPKGANIGITFMSPNTLSFLVLSLGVIRDTNTNTPTYTNVFDAFTIQAGKTDTVESFFVSGRILNTLGGFTKVSAVIIDPTGKTLFQQEGSGTLQAGDFNFSLNFPLKTFTTEGKYKVKIKVNDVICEDNDRYYFFVKKLSS